MNNEHPVLTTKYILASEAIEVLLNDVCTWVTARQAGAIVYGKQRLGKSRAIQYIYSNLSFYLGQKIPVILFQTKTDTKITESTFFGQLLQSENHAFAKRGKGADLRDRYIEYLFQLAKSLNQDVLVFICDEAQKLKEIQYGWLIDIYNELDARGVKMLVILVGQPELMAQRSAYIQTRQLQIVGRFMTHIHEFHGLSSLEHVDRVLKCYDDGSEWPKDSGVTYTQHFLPKAYSNRWRLWQQSKIIWDCLRDAKQNAGLGPLKQISMQAFTQVIATILINASDNDSIDFSLKKDMIFDAIDHSAYIYQDLYYD